MRHRRFVLFGAAAVVALVLVLTVMSLNFAGDRLRSHFDVKESAL